MLPKNIISFARAITTLSPKYIPITAPPSPFLYYDNDTNDNTNVYSYNKTINNLIKSGSLNYALNLFEEMAIRDIVTWNILISGHGKYGLPREAMHLYVNMVSQGITENSSTFSSLLSICCNAGLYQEGLQIHCRVICFGFSRNIYIGSALVDLYLHMGFCDIGLRLFSELPERNVATWNLVLRGFGELGRSNELLELYYNMKEEGVVPNMLTFCYLIKGCGNERFLDEGKQLHCYVIKMGWDESNLFVENAFVDFYSACGSVIDARKAFEVIPAEDVISWNSLVSVYANNGFTLNALEMFTKMQLWGKKPSVRSFVGFLNFSSGNENLLLGKQIHCFVLKLGFDCGSVHVESALIDMYGKCGEIESAVAIFDNVPNRGIELCNSLMTSLLQCGIFEDVVELFWLMVDEGIGFDEVSLSATLKALSVSTSASLRSCTLLHCCAIKSGFESDVVVSCSLIDAYSKSGHVNLSDQVFKRLYSANAICFTSIINAYARNGMGIECLETLKTMIEKGLKPDKVTFLCVLTGCNHTGLVEEGKMVFDSMKHLHGIIPERQHYSCMVDLLGRAGLVDEAEGLLKQATGTDDSLMWGSLLRSCRVHRNEAVGRRVAKMLMDLEPENPAAWLLASNFYSEIGDFETSTQIREVAVARKMRKDIGCSLIELENLDIDEGDEIELFDFPTWTSRHGSKVLVNVDSFGAVGNGSSDDTQAFADAWKQACSTPKSVFLVPIGRRYLVNATKFRGPCADKLVIQIDGTIVAPDEPKSWDVKNPRIWLEFTNLKRVLFQGGGVIDGSGSKWWAASCKTNKANPCKGAPTAFTIDSSSAVRVKGLTIQNSQQMHFTVSRSQSVHLSGIQISSPEDSPNTDGIHITDSTNIIVQNSKISTGDDCISIVNGSSYIKMKAIYCGPGHGISIGSLGKDNSTGIVSRVVVDTAFLRGTTNGLRIKTWQGGNGYVRAVRYQNVIMEDVANPIIIDQFYCDSPKSCQNQTSAVEISQIMYRNISGTSKSAKAMKFSCSDSVPCSHIVLNNINLTKKDGTAETYCNSVNGFGYGYIEPSAECLASSDKMPTIKRRNEAELSTSSEEYLIHTEL